MNTRQEQFAKNVDDLIRESQNVTASTSRSVFDMLQNLRKDIVSRIALVKPDSFSSGQLNALLGEIDRNMGEFSHLAGREIGQAQDQQFLLGQKIVDQPLAQVGMGAMLTGLPRETLVIAQGYSASLISGISHQTSLEIDKVLRRDMLGGQQPHDILIKIEKLLGGATGRAETVLFTEVNRMQSMSTQSRLEQMDQRFGKDEAGDNIIEKEWRHFTIGVPREGHVDLDGTSVPVNDPFTVEDYTDANGQVVDSEELMYPRDPNGSLRNTINCHCRTVPSVKIPERGSVPHYGHLEVST